MNDIEKTKVFIFDLLDKYGLQNGYYIDLRWFRMPLYKANLIVKKNFEQVFDSMLNEGIFECKERYFLTKAGEEALMAYIRERDNVMNGNNISINVAPIINQTQTSSSSITLTINFEKILKESVDEKTFNEIKDIIQSKDSQEEKSSKIKGILSTLGFDIVASVLASLITSVL